MIDTNINLDRVYAFVVGVESYDEQEWNNLKGPANDALTFTRWLLEQGVRVENISLFISPDPDSSQNLELNIRQLIKPASKENITTAIDDILLHENKSGDLLYLFWSGHGFMTSGTELSRRHLYYSDSNFTNHKNINITSILHSLKTSTQSSGFPFQFCFIDACANQTYGDRELTAITRSDIRTPNGNQIQRNQVAIYASRMYGVATNNNSEGEGIFSQVLLSKLSQLSHEKILINPQDLIREIRNELDNISFEMCGELFGDENYEYIQNNQVTQLYNEPCVDREAILKTFEQMVLGKTKEHILLVQGNADFGKSWFLDNRLEIAIPDSALSVKMLFKLQNQSIEYVFYRIVVKIEAAIENIGAEIQFSHFRKELKKHVNSSWRSNKSLEISQIKEAIQNQQESRRNIVQSLSAAIAKDLKYISEQRINNMKRKIFLFFDSLNDSDIEVYQFLLTDFLEEISKSSNVVVIICGQADLSPDEFEYRSYCKYFNLCSSENAIDILSWKSFVSEYQRLKNTSYDLIEPHEIEITVQIMSNYFSSIGGKLPPLVIIDRLKDFNEHKRKKLEIV